MIIPKITVVLLVLSTMGDIVTTFIGHLVLPFINESSPIVVRGFPLWVFFIIKVAITIYLIWVLIRKYNYINFTIGRYTFIYFIVLIIFISLGAMVNNYKIISLPETVRDNIPEIPNEQKLEFYKEQVGDLKLIQPEITYNEQKTKIPLLLILLIINMIQFYVWNSFEKERDIHRGYTN